MYFFFNDTATTEIYTLSLHDALPILEAVGLPPEKVMVNLDKYGNTSAASVPIALDEAVRTGRARRGDTVLLVRSEEHTSELQSRQYLVCRLLLEKKNKTTPIQHSGRQ